MYDHKRDRFTIAERCRDNARFVIVQTRMAGARAALRLARRLDEWTTLEAAS